MMRRDRSAEAQAQASSSVSGLNGAPDVIDWLKDGRGLPSRPVKAPRTARSRNAWRENAESLLWAVALALLIRTFILAPFKIPSASMHPTLLEGDRILVNKFIYRFREPRPGDVIVFYYPKEWSPLNERLFDSSEPLLKRLFHAGRPFIKRLIAVGGDEVEIRDGRVYVNGERVQGAEIFEANTYYNQGRYGEADRPVRVPEGSLFVLGDNSASSHDSRFWGFVAKEQLIGEAVCIFWPLNRMHGLQ